MGAVRPPTDKPAHAAVQTAFRRIFHHPRDNAHQPAFAVRPAHAFHDNHAPTQLTDQVLHLRFAEGDTLKLIATRWLLLSRRAVHPDAGGRALPPAVGASNIL